MTLTQAQQIEILEEIAQDPRNRAAQIAAIRALREIGEGKQPAGDWAELDRFRTKKRVAAA
jgi:hypothetical protein